MLHWIGTRADQPNLRPHDMRRASINVAAAVTDNNLLSVRVHADHQKTETSVRYLTGLGKLGDEVADKVSKELGLGV